MSYIDRCSKENEQKLLKMTQSVKLLNIRYTNIDLGSHIDCAGDLRDKVAGMSEIGFINALKSIKGDTFC